MGFSCRRRLSGMRAWASCVGTAVREFYDVKEAEKCEEVVISSPSPVEFLNWVVFGTWVSFFFSLSLSFGSSLFVQSYRSHSSEVTFFSWLFLGLTCVRAGPPCAHQNADMSVMTLVFKVLVSGQDDTRTFFSKLIAGRLYKQPK